MVYIGKLQDDGVVRYITMQPDYYLKNLMRNLKTFYKKEARVDVLIDLGNMVVLNPSPYGAWQGHRDTVHCRAEIRDDKEKKGKHLPRYADSENEFALLSQQALLFKEGQWFINTPNGYSDELPICITFERATPFNGLKIYQLAEKGGLEEERCTTIHSWKELHDSAKANNKCYYVFRNDKLVATINHPINQQ